MATIIDQLLQSPKLVIYHQRLLTMLEAEQERREKFYATITENIKAEFINGEMIMHSPAKYEHTTTAKFLFKVLDTYVERHHLGYVGYEKMLITLTRNDYEPDICFFRSEVATTFMPKQMQFPAPDLIVEVLSPSTENIDRGIKFEDYAAHGVGEYWLIDPDTRIVEQYLLDGDVYALQIKARSGIITSTAVEGFTIPIAAIFESNANMAALQDILNG
jgi:Uma2 family endonuclease